MGFSVNLLSNATQMDESTIQKLADLHISSFGTTLFSLKPSVHDAITGVNGSLTKTLSNIALLKEYSINIEVKTPIMKTNQLHYGEVQQFCDENGFSFTPTPTITSRTNGDTSTWKLRVADEHLDAIAEMIMRRTSEAAEAILRADKEDESLCPNIRNSIFVDARGEIFPCINFHYKLGDVFSTDVQGAWFSPEREYLLALKKSNLTECLSCDLQQVCYRCPGLALMEDGSLFACSSSAKRMAEAEHRISRKGGWVNA